MSVYAICLCKEKIIVYVARKDTLLASVCFDHHGEWFGMRMREMSAILDDRPTDGLG